MASVSEVKNDVLAKRGRYNAIQEDLHAKEVIIGDEERRRRYILCYNPKEAERQRKRKSEAVRFLKQEISRHPEPKTTAKWAIDLLASKRFRRYFRVTKTGKVRIDHGAIQQAARYDGKWVVETNDDTITLEDAACGYKGLMVIERFSRALKRTRIEMSPLYHWAPRRIEAHVKICALALLMDRVAELRYGRSWSRILHGLQEVQVSYFSTPRYRFFRRNQLIPRVRSVLKSLHANHPNLIKDLSEQPQGP
jgi:hypothetical protein